MKRVVENTLDLVIHPIRIRILMAVAGREMTARQIAEALGDVPPATLYRHLNRLAKAGMLKIVAERQVRGTTEKVYTSDIFDAQVGPDKLPNMSKEDHWRYFTAFIASLLGDFSRYINSGPVNLVADGATYGKFPAELTDAEFAALAKAWGEIMLPAIKNKPAPGRKRRVIATIVVPERPVAAASAGKTARGKKRRG